MLQQNCRRCNQPFSGHHARKYCDKCKDVPLWYRPGRQEKTRKNFEAFLVRRSAKGKEISEKRWLADYRDEPVLRWHVALAVPYSSWGSKNARLAQGWKSTQKRRIYVRPLAKAFHNELVFEFRRALKNRKIVQNKLWIDIFVEKPTNKGDAINFVDTICDALKKSIDLDDRWYCIRHLDWSVNKNDPHIIIGVGQEGEDSQLCSSCGRVLPVALFNKDSGNFRGIGHHCEDCRLQ